MSSTQVALQCATTVCPVFAALLLLQLGDKIPLCSINATHVLSAQVVTRVLWWIAAKESLKPSLFSTHSLRVGGATALHEAGASVDTIKMHGRWASNAYQRYVRLPSAQALNLTARMVKHSGRISDVAASPPQHRGARATTLAQAGRR